MTTHATCDSDVYFVSNELRTLTLTLPPGRTGRVKSVTVVDDTTTFEIELDPPKAAVCPCGINRQDCEVPPVMHWCSDETAALATVLGSFSTIVAWLKATWRRMRSGGT